MIYIIANFDFPTLIWGVPPRGKLSPIFSGDVLDLYYFFWLRCTCSTIFKWKMQTCIAKKCMFFWWQSHSKNTSSHTARFITQMTACFIGWENWKETSWLHFSLQSLQLHPPSHVERSVAWKVFSHFWSTLNELGPTHGSLYWTGTRPCVMEIHAQSCRLSQLWPQRNTTTDSADLYRKNTA